MTYDELVQRCSNGARRPYDYQRRIAEEGLPQLLAAPTGAGKTMAIVLGWLYRRRFHLDLSVRAATPHWLVICQPMRTLVEQVKRDVDAWLQLAGVDSGEEPVNRFVFMGGEPTENNDWRRSAHQDAIIIGTQDMLLSRALNRGFGSSRYLWPVEFGVLNSGCHWVFDEIQLMGAAVPTSRQLEGFRSSYPAILPHGSTWMSATVDSEVFLTVDNPTIAPSLALSESDRLGPLAKRLSAPKTLHELELPSDSKQRFRTLASEALHAHQPGTLSLVIVNTVADAQSTHEALSKSKPECEILLIHSRFRRSDRKRLVDRLVQPVDPRGPGLLCVSTQVIEAGMDLDASRLITEAAPWSSVVQRLGRCNRSGDAVDARALWFAPAKLDKPRPYEAVDVAEAIAVLRSLEGESVIADGLASRGPAPRTKLHPVLRRRDLENLFDTSPEIGGSDIDVTPFVRDLSDDRTVHIAWRPFIDAENSDRQLWKRPNQAELCPAPLGKDLEAWVDKKSVWRYDLFTSTWVALTKRDFRPNQLLLVDEKNGGYSTERGWDPTSTKPVSPVVDDDHGVHEVSERSEDTEDDSASADQKIWVTLSRHLLDAEHQASVVSKGFEFSPRLAGVVATSARLHDIGKAHPVFQVTMRKGADTWPGFDTHAPIAKSLGHHRHNRRCFRHEVASALALLGEARPALRHLDPGDEFLAIYLIAAHHGRARMSLRTMPGDEPNAVFGILDGEQLPALQIGEWRIDGAELRPRNYTGIGQNEDGVIPWQEQTSDLLAQRGPFVLALLEASVRFADWLASANPTDEGFPR